MTDPIGGGNKAMTGGISMLSNPDFSESTTCCSSALLMSMVRDVGKS